MEFLDIPFFDDDFYKMVVRFALDIFFLSIIISGLYFRKTKRRDFVFTYYMIGIIVFFICFTLKKFELDLGMALGLFAIFGILRYRTDTIAIKEMTYLFVVIGVSIINALANRKMSYSEIFGANLIIVAALYIIESRRMEASLSSKTITLDNLDHIRPEHNDQLKQDLIEKTGLNIETVDVGEINFTRPSVKVKIKYHKD